MAPIAFCLIIFGARMNILFIIKVESVTMLNKWSDRFSKHVDY